MTQSARKIETESRFRQKLVDAVGAEYVIAEGDVFQRRAGALIPFRSRPSFVVMPSSTEEVQRVVRIAQQENVHLWAFSRGNNWGYGTTLGRNDGALVVVLERMNRILHVDSELAYAVIEPGVSQKQLNDHLKASGDRLWADCTDSTPNGSVLGNALERGVGYTPYGDHYGQLAGLEVVLPDGEVVRTGGGPGENRTRHTYKYGAGPITDGLFSQSNLGVVTQGGIWIMPKPESFRMVVWRGRRGGELAQIVDAVRELGLRRILANVHIFNAMTMLSTLGGYPWELQEGHRLGLRGLLGIKSRFSLSDWTMVSGLYGTRGEVASRSREVARALKPLGELRILRDESVSLVGALSRRAEGGGLANLAMRTALRSAFGVRTMHGLQMLSPIRDVLKGIPTDKVIRAAFFKNRDRKRVLNKNPVDAKCGMIWFAPIAPARGKDQEELRRLCESTCHAYGFDFACSLILLNPRTFVMMVPVFYDANDPEEAQRAAELHEALVARTSREGFQQYRHSVNHMHAAMEKTGVYAGMLSRIKRALDPNGILAPGRYGVGERRDASSSLPGTDNRVGLGFRHRV